MNSNERKCEELFGLELDKYFKFNSSHFVVYKGFREPLHGHNYKVSVKIIAEKLNENYKLVDSEIIIKIMSGICNNLKHCLLLPKFNNHIEITENEEIVRVR